MKEKSKEEVMEEYKTITEEEIKYWTDNQYSETYLHEIITGEYSLDAAREDVLSFRPKRGG